MRHLKLFESVGFESEITDFWKVDPYEFQRIVSDAAETVDIIGDINIDFGVWHPYPSRPDQDMEALYIFYFDINGDITKAPWYHNFGYIKTLRRKSIMPIIEIRIDSHQFEEDRNLKNRVSEHINKYFKDRKIEYSIHDFFYYKYCYIIEFIYTGDL
jgi:hypothetical protein